MPAAAIHLRHGTRRQRARPASAAGASAVATMRALLGCLLLATTGSAPAALVATPLELPGQAEPSIVAGPG